MNLVKSRLLYAASIIAFLWLCGCNYSSTYRPQLNDKQQAITDTINSKYHFEHISLEAKKTGGTNGNHTILTIKFINGKNIPTDNDKMTALAKQLGSEVKKALKNPGEFESYMILFSTIVVDGSSTNETDTGHVFKSNEL